jgi:hypothetical protein
MATRTPGRRKTTRRRMLAAPEREAADRQIKFNFLEQWSQYLQHQKSSILGVHSFQFLLSYIFFNSNSITCTDYRQAGR